MAGRTKPAVAMPTDEDIDRATAPGNESAAREPKALTVAYSGDRIQIETNRNWGFSFAPGELAELDGANPDQLADVKILGSGGTIEWTTLDVHLGVGAIISTLLGEEFLITEGNRRVASRTSAKKAASSAANGKLGGRPAKKDTIESAARRQ